MRKLGHHQKWDDRSYRKAQKSKHPATQPPQDMPRHQTTHQLMGECR